MALVEAQTIGVSAELPVQRFAAIRRQMALTHCKWDPQVGDTGTLAPFALLLSAGAWSELATLAQSLWQETAKAEAELLEREELWPALAIPRRMRRLLKTGKAYGQTPGAGRVMRFDFHPTSRGWHVSEVNSDVPGGYSEAWELPRLLAAEVGGGWLPAGDPGGAWAQSIARHANGYAIGLICAAGYMEDRQVVAYLARRLRACGCEAVMADLREIAWANGEAFVRGRPLGAIVRFFQAEWLANLPRRWGWERLFVGGKTAVTNPGRAILTESKGFPLTWDQLQTNVDTWRSLLPTTRPATYSTWRRDGHWLLKGKFGNNGDEVILPGLADARALRHAERDLWWRPTAWVMQERFETTTVETPRGPMHPCIGVYVIDGEVSGIYGRLSRGAVVDYAALDVAVLVEGGVR